MIVPGSIGKTGKHQDRHWASLGSGGWGPGRNGRVAVGRQETLQGWLDMRRWEEPAVSSGFCACEWAFERRGRCGDSTGSVALGYKWRGTVAWVVVCACWLLTGSGVV